MQIEWDSVKNIVKKKFNHKHSVNQCFKLEAKPDLFSQLHCFNLACQKIIHFCNLTDSILVTLALNFWFMETDTKNKCTCTYTHHVCKCLCVDVLWPFKISIICIFSQLNIVKRISSFSPLQYSSDCLWGNLL